MKRLAHAYVVVKREKKKERKKFVWNQILICDQDGEYGKAQKEI